MTPKAFVGSVSMLHACNQAKDLKQEIPKTAHQWRDTGLGGLQQGSTLGMGFKL